MANAETKKAMEPKVVERPKPVSEALVSVTVTKFGEGRVSTGIHVAGEGDIFASKGDALEVSRAVAASLEARGFAEIA